MRLMPESEMNLGAVAKLILGCDKSQLAIGTAVELEHTGDPEEAKRICIDHLKEDPNYYTKPMKKDWGPEEAMDRIEELAKVASTERTFRQIHEDEDPDGKGHDLFLKCTKCETSETCRCSKPKREFRGICDSCAKTASGKLVTLVDGACECPSCGKKSRAKASALSGHGMRHHACPHCGDDFFVQSEEPVEFFDGAGGFGRVASVFVLEDDPERIRIFNMAYGEKNVVSTKSTKTALEILRNGKFAKVFLDRDLSSTTENGEDLAWQMSKENLCRNTPVVIHSENTRGQKVMSRYLGKYHNNVTVTPFRTLRKQLEIPGGVRI